MSKAMLWLMIAGLCLALVDGKICVTCDCAFVNITRIRPGPEERISFEYKADMSEPFSENSTSDHLEKYFYVDCSSEKNVGQIKNLDWPKLNVLGILANFQSSKWKKLESFPEIIKKQMTVLSMSDNLVSEIDDFELDSFSNLEMLNLSQNQIRAIKKGNFNKLHALRILDLSKNWLAEIEDWAFYGTALQFLNLSRNAITSLTPDVFRSLNNLTVLDLSDNRLTKLPDELSDFLPSLKWLSVRKNAFQRLPKLPKDLNNFDVSFNELLDLHLFHVTLESLNVGHNELRSLAHANLPMLKVLRASHNNLTGLSSLQSGQIRILDVSYNNLDWIPGILTSDKLPFLRELYLDGNPIANISFPLQSEPFSDLRIVSLSHLKLLKKIDKNSFEGILPAVEYDCMKENGTLVNLSHGSIKFVDEDAFKDIFVCRVDLSRNNLKTLSRELLPWLKMSHVNLQENPWQCDCNIQWMLDELLVFMYENNPRLLFNLRCGTPLRFKNKQFAFWYNKSEKVFCNSGPSSLYIDLAGGKKIEIWTASAITCVILGLVILVTGVVIVVLVCTRPAEKKKSAKKNKSKGPPYYRQIPNSENAKSREYGEKSV